MCGNVLSEDQLGNKNEKWDAEKDNNNINLIKKTFLFITYEVHWCF